MILELVLGVLVLAGIFTAVKARPVRRFKGKARILGRKRHNYVRLFPNPGLQIGSFHWCRAKHRRGF